MKTLEFWEQALDRAKNEVVNIKFKLDQDNIKSLPKFVLKFVLGRKVRKQMNPLLYAYKRLNLCGQLRQRLKRLQTTRIPYIEEQIKKLTVL